MSASDNYGNLLMGGIDFGSKYLAYKSSEDDTKDEDIVDSMMKQNRALLNRPSPMNPLKEQIKRAEAVGLDLMKLQNKEDPSLKTMDNWIGVLRG